MPQVDPSGGGQGSLKDIVKEWARLDERIKAYMEYEKNPLEGEAPPGYDPAKIGDLRKQRRDAAAVVVRLVEQNPDRWDRAVKFGFNETILENRANVDAPSTGGGSTPQAAGAEKVGGQNQPVQPGTTTTDEERVRDRDKDKDEDKLDLTQRAIDNRLLGDKGKDYDLVRGPKGSYVVRYKWKIGGETVTIGLRIKEGELSKYGFKASDAKRLSKAQLKRVKNVGWVGQLAPHIKKGDKHVIKSLVRSLRTQYGGQPILENDGVMATIIANSMFGWTPGEFENQLRQTKWYQKTNSYQRDWQLSTSKKERTDRIRQTKQQVVDYLEDAYGLDWTRHVEGGMGKAREWAERIASGRFGDPSEGFQFWADRQFDKAKEIENTPAWIKQQQDIQERNAFLNQPEEVFEQLKNQSLAYLGQADDDTPLIDRATLQAWAGDLVSGNKSDHDWQSFLRQQSRAMYPHFDPNLPWQDQASPYKAQLEQIVGTSVGWSDPMLRKLQAFDDSGKPTENAMSLYDYAQFVRDNDPRFWENPRTEERGRQFAQGVLAKMTGGAF